MKFVSTVTPLRLPQLEQCTSTDDLRPAMQYIEIVDGIATAVDGHVLIRIDLSKFMDEQQVQAFNQVKYIHRVDWKFLRKLKIIALEAVLFSDTSRALKVKYIDSIGPRENTITLISFVGHSFPNYHSIMPSQEDLAPMDFVQINPVLFKKVCAAAGNPHSMRFYLNKNRNRAILFTVQSEDMDAVGLIMPQSHNDRDTLEDLRRFFVKPEPPKQAET